MVPHRFERGNDRNGESRCAKMHGDFRFEVFRAALRNISHPLQGCILAKPSQAKPSTKKSHGRMLSSCHQYAGELVSFVFERMSCQTTARSYPKDIRFGVRMHPTHKELIARGKGSQQLVRIFGQSGLPLEPRPRGSAGAPMKWSKVKTVANPRPHM